MACNFLQICLRSILFFVNFIYVYDANCQSLFYKAFNNGQLEFNYNYLHTLEYLGNNPFEVYPINSIYVNFAFNPEEEIDYQKINYNTQITELTLNYWPGKNFYPISIPQFEKLKNIKYVSILGLTKTDFHYLYEQLAKMPKLEGLMINSLPYKESDIKNLQIIFKRLKNLIIPYNLEIPIEIENFEKLEGIGFMGENRSNTAAFLNNKVNAPNLYNIAFESECNPILLRNMHNKFHEITEIYLVNVSPLKKENYVELSRFKNLKTLRLVSKTTEIDGAISMLTNLDTLSIGGFLYKEGFRVDSILGLKKLKKLELIKIDKITNSEKFKNLNQLEELIIDNTYVPHFSFDFDSFHNLRKLVLRNIDLQHIPEEIYQCKKLKVLDVSYNNISNISNSIAQLEILEELNLGINNLKILPDSLVKLHKLKLLNLDWNELSVLPPQVGNLSSLEVFEAYGNLLTELPASIDELFKLKKLDLSGNQLKSCPDSFKKLINLEYLNFGDESCKKGFVEGKIKREQKIRSNMFENFDVDFSGFSKLKYLNMKDFKISRTLFESLWKTPLDFESINLNEIQSIPSSNWYTKKGNFLNLGYILDGNIPDSMFFSKIDNIYFSVIKNNVFEHFHIYDDASKSYAKYKLGKINFDDMKKDSFLFKYILNIENKSIEDYRILFGIDSIKTMKKINMIDYVNLLDRNKKYEEAIDKINFALNKSGVSYTDNQIINLINKKIGVLKKLKKGSDALDAMLLLDSVYNINYANDIGFYFLEKGDKSRANKYFTKSINEALWVYNNRSSDRKNIQLLNLLELLFLKEDHRAIDSIFTEIENTKINFNKLNRVYSYFKLLRNAGSLDTKTNEINTFKSQCNAESYFHDGWNCDLIERWKKFQPINKEKDITILNKILCKYLFVEDFSRDTVVPIMEVALPLHEKYRHIQKN